MLLVIDNFLIAEECEELIKIYRQNKHLVRQWPPKAVGPCAHVINTSYLFNPLLKKILSQTQKVVKQYFDPQIFIDWAELKKHDDGASHPFHFDLPHLLTDTDKVRNNVLFSVTYLNTLSSGYTVFKDGTKVSPKIGRLLLFNGQKYSHGVNECKEERYTVSIWWYKLSSHKM